MAFAFFRRFFLVSLLIVSALLAVRFKPGFHPQVSADARYDSVPLAFLAEQNHLYRDAVMTGLADLKVCEKSVNDVLSWNGPSPVLRNLQAPLEDLRYRLRASLHRRFEGADMKSSFAVENHSFHQLLDDGYLDIWDARLGLASYTQGVQSRAGGSVAAVQLESCRAALAAWRSRVAKPALPDELLAWRQKN